MMYDTMIALLVGIVIGFGIASMWRDRHEPLPSGAGYDAGMQSFRYDVQDEIDLIVEACDF